MPFINRYISLLLFYVFVYYYLSIVYYYFMYFHTIKNIAIGTVKQENWWKSD